MEFLAILVTGMTLMSYLQTACTSLFWLHDSNFKIDVIYKNYARTDTRIIKDGHQHECLCLHYLTGFATGNIGKVPVNDAFERTLYVTSI